jgi:hypothetical protein
MKHLLCPLMMMLALIVGSQTVNAQKFSSMTEEQRNDTLNILALAPCGAQPTGCLAPLCCGARNINICLTLNNQQ